MPADRHHDAPAPDARAPDEPAPDHDATLDDAAPPLLGSWSRVYALVLGVLVFQVVIYFALTRWAS